MEKASVLRITWALATAVLTGSAILVIVCKLWLLGFMWAKGGARPWLWDKASRDLCAAPKPSGEMPGPVTGDPALLWQENKHIWGFRLQGKPSLTSVCGPVLPQPLLLSFRV